MGRSAGSAADDDETTTTPATPATPTPGQYEASLGPLLDLQSRITSPNPPASISVPSTSLSCALVSLYLCPTLPCMSLCAISRALSRFHHVIISHPSNLDSNLDSTHIAHPPVYSQDRRLFLQPRQSVTPTSPRQKIFLAQLPTQPAPIRQPSLLFRQITSIPPTAQRIPSKPCAAPPHNHTTSPTAPSMAQKTLLATALDADHGASRPLPLPFLCSSTSENRLSFFLSLTHTHTSCLLTSIAIGGAWPKLTR
jgi:hypothetical protein